MSREDNDERLKDTRRGSGHHVKTLLRGSETGSDSGMKRTRQRSGSHSPARVCCTSSESSTLIHVQKAAQTPLCPSGFSLPRGTLHKDDEPIIELYFSRHPSELVISSEFVDEMNANVLQVFLEDPEGVCESLSAIGHVYLDGGQTLVPILGRKARILARLRDGTQLEQVLLMLLGLCAIEVCFALLESSKS